MGRSAWSRINLKRAAMFGVLSGTLWIHTGMVMSADPPVAAIAPDEGTLKWFPCEGWAPGCEGALLWGDPTRGPSGFYVRAPKGYLFPRHTHASPERIAVLRGRISGAVDGTSDAMVSPGMYWGFAGNAVHWARCEDACLMYITYDLPFDVAFR
jgi:hypothetical protein